MEIKTGIFDDSSMGQKIRAPVGQLKAWSGGGGWDWRTTSFYVGHISKCGSSISCFLRIFSIWEKKHSPLFNAKIEFRQNPNRFTPFFFYFIFFYSPHPTPNVNRTIVVSMDTYLVFTFFPQLLISFMPHPLKKKNYCILYSVVYSVI